MSLQETCLKTTKVASAQLKSLFRGNTTSGFQLIDTRNSLLTLTSCRRMLLLRHGLSYDTAEDSSRKVARTMGIAPTGSSRISIIRSETKRLLQAAKQRHECCLLGQLSAVNLKDKCVIRAKPTLLSVSGYRQAADSHTQ